MYGAAELSECVKVKAAEPTTHIACDRVGKECERLKEIYGQLVSRLDPILLPSNPRAASANQNGRDGCLIAKRVGEFAEVIGTICDDMQDIIRRLDV
mgnify:CR=1 FL=1